MVIPLEHSTEGFADTSDRTALRSNRCNVRDAGAGSPLRFKTARCSSCCSCGSLQGSTQNTSGAEEPSGAQSPETDGSVVAEVEPLLLQPLGHCIGQAKPC